MPEGKLQSARMLGIGLRASALSSLLDSLQRREIDGIFTNHIFSDRSIKVVETLSSPVFLCCKRRALAPSETKTTESAAAFLKANPIGLLLPGIDNKLRTECDEYLIRNRIQNTIIFESDIMAAVIRAATRGLGAGFFPLVYVIPEINNQTLITLGTFKPLWNHRITFAVSSAVKEEAWMTSVTEKFSSVKSALDQTLAKLSTF